MIATATGTTEICLTTISDDVFSLQIGASHSTCRQVAVRLRQGNAQEKDGNAGVLDARLYGDGQSVAGRLLQQFRHHPSQSVAQPRQAHAGHDDLEQKTMPIATRINVHTLCLCVPDRRKAGRGTSWRRRQRRR